MCFLFILRRVLYSIPNPFQTSLQMIWGESRGETAQSKIRPKFPVVIAYLMCVLIIIYALLQRIQKPWALNLLRASKFHLRHFQTVNSGYFEIMRTSPVSGYNCRQCPCFRFTVKLHQCWKHLLCLHWCYSKSEWEKIAFIYPAR